ncbi:hypothetical protein LY474_04800 [Myxococcus stipitatus]|uniref:hypothetical protein n=1 Tax=Myxococcus stipitatus TaxID=83455 RepID=UPI001F274856|nr:hypothetical protein [Myxococcus stipitatus]MCE9667128.1 hypothetical protein [Myxococcus stipitatus]
MSGPPEPPPSIFRKEALEHSQRVVQEKGELLRIAPTWTRWSGVLMTAFAIALAVGALYLTGLLSAGRFQAP